MFDFFALQPILPSEQRQSAWISKQSGRKLHKYCDEFKDMLCSNISTNYDLSQKGKVKAGGDASLQDSLQGPEGQDSECDAAGL